MGKKKLSTIGRFPANSLGILRFFAVHCSCSQQNAAVISKKRIAQLSDPFVFEGGFHWLPDGADDSRASLAPKR